MSYIYDRLSSSNIVIFGPTYLDLDSFCLCLDFYQSELWYDLGYSLNLSGIDRDIFKYYLEKYMLGYVSFNDVFIKSIYESQSLTKQVFTNKQYSNYYSKFNFLLKRYCKSISMNIPKSRKMDVYHRVYQISRLKGSSYLLYYISCIELKSCSSLRQLIKNLSLPVLTREEERFILNYEDNTIGSYIEVLSNMIGGV